MWKIVTNQQLPTALHLVDQKKSNWSVVFQWTHHYNHLKNNRFREPIKQREYLDITYKNCSVNETILSWIDVSSIECLHLRKDMYYHNSRFECVPSKQKVFAQDFYFAVHWWLGGSKSLSYNFTFTNKVFGTVMF